VNVLFDQDGWAGYLYWQEHDRTVLERLNRLIEGCRRHPFKGTGRPEPLKGDFAGFWSRRITLEDRLVYRVVGKGDEQRLEIAQCRYHY
jgi:toxin YoeB